MNLFASLEALLARRTSFEPALVHMIARLIAVALTAAVLLIFYRVLVHLVSRLLAPREGETERSPRVQRIRTLNSLLTNIVRWLTAFVGLVIVLRELGVDVQAVLVSAGVLGLAIGLGAQTLVRDIITGFFLLFEGLVGVGDVIETGAHTGTVEAIGLRVTKLRMFNGALRVIPNGQLTEFANYSRGWARAIVDVGLSSEVSAGRALEVLRRVGDEWAQATGLALERPQAHGIIRFSGGDMVLRLAAKVDPAKRLDVETELRRRIKEAFEPEQWRPIGPLWT